MFFPPEYFFFWEVFVICNLQYYYGEDEQVEVAKRCCGWDGAAASTIVGARDRAAVGARDRAAVGARDSAAVGARDGSAVGERDVGAASLARAPAARAQGHCRPSSSPLWRRWARPALFQKKCFFFFKSGIFLKSF